MLGNWKVTTQPQQKSEEGERELPIVSLSSLQHYVFCPRQCALIHNEQVWEENYLTAQGNALHERVDSGEIESRKGIRFERSVHVAALKLGVIGVVDMVEYNSKEGSLKPVEYKRGKPKHEPFDEVQLCAQALCLEEMTGKVIAEGGLWYMQTRHRITVKFSDELRLNTLSVISKVRELLASGKTPPPIQGKHCNACSLIDICQPELFMKDRSVAYLEELFERG